MTAKEQFREDISPVGKPQLERQVAEMIRRRLHIEMDDPSIDLFDTGLVDSLGLIELLVGLESEFGIRIGTGELDIDDFRSIERIATYLMDRTIHGS
jgi:acyl carrier protein